MTICKGSNIRIIYEHLNKSNLILSNLIYQNNI